MYLLSVSSVGSFLMQLRESTPQATLRWPFSLLCRIVPHAARYNLLRDPSITASFSLLCRIVPHAAVIHVTGKKRQNAFQSPLSDRSSCSPLRYKQFISILHFI